MKSIVLRAGEPLLRRVADDLSPDDIRTPEVQQIIAELIQAMFDTDGIGMAAPQIGHSIRLIVLEDREELISRLPEKLRVERERYPFSRKVIANPTWTPVGQQKALYFEACRSVPGYYALVERYLEVVLTGLNETGSPMEWQVRGWPARIIQHEADHLDGILFTDKMVSRSLCTDESAVERWLKYSAEEFCAALGIRR